jgi:hypothetical protein
MLVVLAQGSGCSWIFVTKPPPGPVEAEPPVTCTTSAVSPVLDTVLAGLAVAGGITVIALSVPKSSSCTGGWCFDIDMSGFNTAGYITGGVLIAGAVPWGSPPPTVTRRRPTAAPCVTRNSPA